MNYNAINDYIQVEANIAHCDRLGEILPGFDQSVVRRHDAVRLFNEAAVQNGLKPLHHPFGYLKLKDNVYDYIQDSFLDHYDEAIEEIETDTSKIKGTFAFDSVLDNHKYHIRQMMKGAIPVGVNYIDLRHIPVTEEIMEQVDQLCARRVLLTKHWAISRDIENKTRQRAYDRYDKAKELLKDVLEVQCERSYEKGYDVPSYYQDEVVHDRYFINLVQDDVGDLYFELSAKNEKGDTHAVRYAHVPDTYDISIYSDELTLPYVYDQVTEALDLTANERQNLVGFFDATVKQDKLDTKKIDRSLSLDEWLEQKEVIKSDFLALETLTRYELMVSNLDYSPLYEQALVEEVLNNEQIEEIEEVLDMAVEDVHNYTFITPHPGDKLQVKMDGEIYDIEDSIDYIIGNVELMRQGDTWDVKGQMVGLKYKDDEAMLCEEVPFVYQTHELLQTGHFDMIACTESELAEKINPTLQVQDEGLSL